MSENTEEVNLVNLIVSIYKTVVYRKTIVAISFIISFSIGLTYLLQKVPVYKTEMVISSPVVTSERITFFVEPLGKLANEKNYQELSNLLQVDSSISNCIKDIEATELKDNTKAGKSDNYDSEILRQQNCLVTVKYQGSSSLSDSIQSGIVRYLRNNNFIKRRTEIEMNNLLNLKKRIRNEISELDSLRRKISKNPAQYTMMDPSSINNSIANLYQQELVIDLKMKLDDGGVNIIRDFVKYKAPIEPKRNVILGICFVGGILLSYISIIVISVREKIIKD